MRTMSCSAIEKEAVELFRGFFSEVGFVDEEMVSAHSLITETEDGEVIGAALYEKIDGLTLLHALAVAEPSQGNGHGQALVDDVASATDGDIEAKVQTELPANEFYADCGFELVRQTNDEYMNVWVYTQ